MKKIIGLIFAILSAALHALEPADKERLTKLAKAGDSEAMYALFVDVGERGENQPLPSSGEYQQAKEWLLKAGELNNWRAAYVLQLCYTKGCWGLVPNKQKAEHYKNVVAKFGPNK